MKDTWLEDHKKRPASAPSDEPAPKHRDSALASAPAASAAAGVWTGLIEQSQNTHPGIQVPGVARAVAITGTCVLVKVLSSQAAW